MRVFRLVWCCGQWLALALFLATSAAWWRTGVTGATVTLTSPIVGKADFTVSWIFTDAFGGVQWTTLWCILAAVVTLSWLPTLRRWCLRDTGARLRPRRWAWRLLLAVIPTAWFVLCYVDYQGPLAPDVLEEYRIAMADRCLIACRGDLRPGVPAPRVWRRVSLQLDSEGAATDERAMRADNTMAYVTLDTRRFGVNMSRLRGHRAIALSPILTGSLLLPLALPLVSAWRVWRRRRNREERNACMTCGYSLQGLPERRCPECGTDAPAVRPAPRRPTWAWRVALLALPAAAWLLWGWMQFDADHALFAGDNPPSEPLPNAWLFVGGAPPEPADGPEARSSVFFVQEARYPFEDPAPTWRDGDDFGFRVVSWDGRRCLAIRASFIVWTAHLAAIPLALALLRRTESTRRTSA